MLATAAATSWQLLLVAAVVALVGWVASVLSVAVLPAVLALALAAIFVPPVRWLERKGWHAGAATFAVLLTTIGGFVGVVLLIVPRFAAQFATLRAQLATATTQLGAQFGLRAPSLDLTDLQDRLIGLAQQHVGELVRGADIAVRLLAGVALTLVLLFFFVKDRRQIHAWIMRQLPARHRRAAHAVLLRGWQTVGGYFRGFVLVAIIDALGIGLGLAVIGVPLVLSLMVLTFVGAFIPLIGAFTAGLTAVLVAFVSGGPTDALLALAVIVVVQQVEGAVLHPTIMRRTVRLHPVVVLLSLTAGGALAGISGAFLAVPTVAVAVAMGAEFRTQRA